MGPFSPPVAVPSLCALFASAALASGQPRLEQRDDRVTLANDHLRVLFEDGSLRRVEDVATGETLLRWSQDEPAWYIEFGTRTVSPGPHGELAVSRTGGLLTVSVRSATRTPDQVDAIYRVALGDDPWAELSMEVSNQAGEEAELVGFPANALCAKGNGRFFVYPYHCGALLPLDERFDRIRIYGTLPFVHGYPSDRCTMQWQGAMGPRASVMLMGTDRYGSLRRLGAVDAGQDVRFVAEIQASLAPGKSFRPTPWRVVTLPGGGYEDMARVYRSWVRQIMAPGARVKREQVGAVERIPLQFMRLRDKLAARPHLQQVMTTHGYPEHAVREDAGRPIPYVPYGMLVELTRTFRRLYRSPVTPQLWSPFVEGARGWQKFPHRRFLEEPLTVQGHTFPGMALGELLRSADAEDTPVFLYVNPTFWPDGAPGYDTSLMFDKDGDGAADTYGGFEAGASSKPAYVSPYLVREHMVKQLGRLAAFAGDPAARANGIMFDSSQVFGATLWGNSRLRRDPISCLDRNPRAHYRERYGYLGRDSHVQDKLGTYVALHEATPHACKVGEWTGEFQTLFLDLNAGSVDLWREYPDSQRRPPDENLVPVPLFQMVYGDSQLFVIRVGAASDANLGAPDPLQTIPAEVSRRSSAMFGAIHQVVYWGGVRWAGGAFGRLRGRTWQVVHDNAARGELFGRRVSYRMLDPQGNPHASMFAVRETSWLDKAGRVVALHWDNNSGGPAEVAGTLDGQTVRSSLWGSEVSVEHSLDRLREGSTVTLTRRGTFALWGFAGEVRLGDSVPVSVTDTAPTPRGLSIVWDGGILSLGNESPHSRSVTVLLPRRGGTLSPIEPVTLTSAGERVVTYNQAESWTVHREGRSLRLEVGLPGARPDPGDRPLAVPAAIAAFEHARTPAGTRGR